MQLSLATFYAPGGGAQWPSPIFETRCNLDWQQIIDNIGVVCVVCQQPKQIDEKPARVYDKAMSKIHIYISFTFLEMSVFSRHLLQEQSDFYQSFAAAPVAKETQR